MVIGKYRITQRGYVVFGATGILLILLIAMQVKQLLGPMPNEINPDTTPIAGQTQNSTTGDTAAAGGVSNSGENTNTTENAPAQGGAQENLSANLTKEEKNKIMAAANCTIYFKPDEYALDDAFYSELNAIVEMSKRFKDTKIIIDGHFNGVPGQKTTEFRVSLAQNRAEMVEAYLISQGIDSERLKVNNLGCTDPVNKDDSWQEIEKNRRVEVYFETLY